MKKPFRGFSIEVGKSAIIGIEPGSVLTISLGADSKGYSAPIEKIHATLARWHAREHPTGKRRRRLFTSTSR